MKQGNLNEPERSKRFDNPDGYLGLMGIPKRHNQELYSDGPSLVDTSCETHSPPKVTP